MIMVPGVMLMYERTSKDRKKERSFDQKQNARCFKEDVVLNAKYDHNHVEFYLLSLCGEMFGVSLWPLQFLWPSDLHSLRPFLFL